jgi:predicted enzyme related to lactoylglutathione lyase
MSEFVHVELRTHDIEEARSFYEAVLGPTSRRLGVVPLPPLAVARGAPPHWLGYLEVDDVDAALTAFVRRGAVALGSPWVSAEGFEAATVRDPSGAVLALAKRAPARQPAPMGPGTGVVWHDLNAIDVDRAKATYGELFGWRFLEPFDLGPSGTFHPFAWGRGGAAVGTMCDVAGRRGVHPHWLFHFRVDSLDRAMDAVRAGGGYAVGPVMLPGGEQVVVCDDSQGAAFAMRAYSKF